jgi:hypothetical protein
MECAGKARRRRRFVVGSPRSAARFDTRRRFRRESGVALRLLPQTKLVQVKTTLPKENTPNCYRALRP